MTTSLRLLGRLVSIILLLISAFFACGVIGSLVYGNGLISIFVAMLSGLFAWKAYQGHRSVSSAAGENPPKAAPIFAWLITLAGVVFLVYFSLLKADDLFRNGYESQTKGHLGAIRSTLSIYYGDNQSSYPNDLAALTVGGKYMNTFPTAHSFHHRRSAAVQLMTNDDFNAGIFTDKGGWAYVIGGSTKSHDGTILVNCTHTDLKGSSWVLY